MNWVRNSVLVVLLGMMSAPAQWAFSQAAPPIQQNPPATQPQFPNLGEGLKRTPGCLGVETARTESGKEVIFAWFKDKQAVLNWYHSDMHQGVMRKFFPNRSQRDPLADIPDDAGPIMAIASITFSDQPRFANSPLPISQIAIELYTPVSGGLWMGGRFGPESMAVEGMQDYAKKDDKQP